MPPVLTRDHLRPGETGLLFNALGGLDPSALRLRTAADDELPVETPNVARRAVQAWDRQYHCGVTIPADASAGDYQLVRAGEPSGLPVTVELPRPKQYQQVWKPGVYVLESPISLQPDRHLVGYGVTLVRRWDSSYQNHIFEPAANVTLEGFTIRWEPHPGVPAGAPRYVFAPVDVDGPNPTDPPVRNVTLRNCAFHAGGCEGAQLGEWDRPGFLAEDCLFDGVAAGSVTGPCLFLRCRWTGPTRDGLNAFSTRGTRGISLVDCDMDGTDRGPCFNADRGPVTDCLFSGLRASGLDWCANGCESFGMEGPHGVTRLAILHYRYSGCGAALLPYSADVADVLVRDFTIRDGVGVVVGSLEGPRHERIVLQDGEIHGGCPRFGPGAFDCAVRGAVLLIDPRPTLASEFGLNQLGNVPWGVPPGGYENVNGPAVNDLSGLRVPQVAPGRE